jgi:hypothetical protein
MYKAAYAMIPKPARLPRTMLIQRSRRFIVTSWSKVSPKCRRNSGLTQRCPIDGRLRPFSEARKRPLLSGDR